MNNELLVQVASTFVCTPIETSLRQTLAHAGVAGELGFVQFTQMSEYLLSSAPNSPQLLGTVIFLRLEDWVREHLTSSSQGSAVDAAIRQEFRPRVEEFVSQLAILSRLGKQVWFLACPSTGWVSGQHKLAGLCRTFTNLVVARVRGLPQVTLLSWPSTLSEGKFEDLDADSSRQIPFTPDAFQRLGESVGNQLARTVARRDSGVSQAGPTKSPELAAYLARLNVRVQLAAAGTGDRYDMERLLRTVASFSLTGENPTISGTEIDKVLTSEGCVLVRVVDRTSDHGASGLIAFRSIDDDLVVESMALSCTVLGKQVEYAVLSVLGQIAANRRRTRLVFEYRPSARNQPMLAFLRQILNQESDTRYVLPVCDVEARIELVAVNNGAWEITRSVE